MQDIGPVVFGKYQLLELLARGGMAEVYKAKSYGVEGFEKVLVIKRILPELSRDPDFVEMFINEAKIAVTLSHANIVQVFDLGKVDDRYFIAMEFVLGVDLAAAVGVGPLPVALAIYIISEVAKALDYAHRRRDSNMQPMHIVHRDVTPHNVLLSFEGEVKLTDFGIAKARTRVETKGDGSVIKGKCAYMAPEIIEGQRVDASSDLYALGVVMYEALVGRNPFVKKTELATLEAVRTATYIDVQTARPNLSDAVAKVVRRAMHRDPAERFSSAGQMYEELMTVLYTSGDRVGAMDLARHIQPQRPRSRPPRLDSEPRLPSLSDAFLPTVLASNPANPALTRPVSTPSGDRESVISYMPPPVKVQHDGQFRDAAIVVVTARDKETLLLPQIARAAARHHGTVVGEPNRRVSEGGYDATVLFGVDVADGREVQSAVRFALRVMRSLAVGDSQELSQSKVGTWVHAGALPQGESVSPQDGVDRMRAEVASVAPAAIPGKMLVSRAAYRVCSSVLDVVPCSETLDTFEVVRERLGGLLGRFVGRRNELRRAGEMLALANRGQLVSVLITGEAGLGKTRLALEVRRRLRLGGHDVGIFVSSIARGARSLPFSTITELLRAIVGIEWYEKPDAMRARLARLRELGVEAHESAAIGYLLGAEATPPKDAMPRALRRAMLRILSRLARDRLTVFIVDGADQIDPESEAILSYVFGELQHVPLLMIGTARNLPSSPWSSSLHSFEVPLQPLDEDECRMFLASRLGAEEVPQELVSEVFLRSGGNPAYLEELIRVLGERGSVVVFGGTAHYHPPQKDTDIPRTMRGLVSARVSRLTPLERNILQTAAVLGFRFSAPLLEQVTGQPHEAVAQCLRQAEDRGFVSRLGEHDFALASEHIGDVLRDSLTIDAYRELCRKAASALEYVFDTRKKSVSERIAYLQREAGDRKRAAAFLVEAAERLRDQHAFDASLTNLDEAVSLLSQVGQSHKTDAGVKVLSYIQLSGEVAWQGRRLEAGLVRMTRGIEVATSLARDDYGARFSLMRARFLIATDRVDEANRWLEEAKRLSDLVKRPDIACDVTLAFAESMMHVGDHQRATEYYRDADQAARALNKLDKRLSALIPLALAQATSGDTSGAHGTLNEARTLLAVLHDRLLECELLKCESLVYAHAFEFEKAVETAHEGFELAQEFGFFYDAAVNLHNAGEMHLRMGDSTKAYLALVQSLHIAKDHGFESLQAVNRMLLGFIDAMQLGTDSGRQQVLDAVQFSEKSGNVWDLIQGKYLLAIIERENGRGEAARSFLREVVRSAELHQHASYAHAARAALDADASLPIMLPGARVALNKKDRLA